MLMFLVLVKWFILNNKKDAADNYLNMLKAGGSMYAMDLFKVAGIDMTSPEPINSAYKDLSNMVDKLEILAT